MEEEQGLIQNATVLVEHPFPDRTRRNEWKQPREEQERAQDSAKREPAFEEQRKSHSDHELSGDRADREQRGVDHRRLEQRVLENADIVRETDPWRNAREKGARGVVLETHDDVLHERIAKEEAEIDHSWQDERRLGQAFERPPPLPPAANSRFCRRNVPRNLRS